MLPRPILKRPLFKQPTLDRPVRNRRILCALALALATSAAFAPVSQSHETLPREWCANPQSTPRIIATMQLGSRELHRLAISYGTPDHCPVATCGSCGGVDEWHPARAIAQAYCEQFDPRPDQVQAFVLTPDFNSAAHHSDYKFSDELSFQCVVCD
jgi:hypothetical protein